MEFRNVFVVLRFESRDWRSCLSHSFHMELRNGVRDLTIGDCAHLRLHMFLAAKHSHSECYASSSLRFPFLADILQHCPGALNDILSSGNEVRTPFRACQALGFQNHPTVLKSKGRLGTREHHPELVRLLYHADAHSLFRRPPVQVQKFRSHDLATSIAVADDGLPDAVELPQFGP